MFMLLLLLLLLLLLVCVCVCVCVCVWWWWWWWWWWYLCMCVCARARACACVRMSACICACVRACVRARVRFLAASPTYMGIQAQDRTLPFLTSFPSCLFNSVTVGQGHRICIRAIYPQVIDNHPSIRSTTNIRSTTDHPTIDKKLNRPTHRAATAEEGGARASAGCRCRPARARCAGGASSLRLLDAEGRR